MKNFEIKKEIWIWGLVALPMVYLMYVWSSLPEIVPTHFGIDGQPNDWSHKTLLIYVVGGMTVGMYLLFTFIPFIDPKGKFSAMGNKYFLLKLFMMLFMCILCFFIIQSAITGTVNNNYLFLVIGGLFVFLGNYMQTLKPNYFIGIRTPWTLENETIWRKTHLMGGKLFFVAGLLVMILSLIFKENFSIIFLVIILTTAFIPIIYSYILFNKEKQGIKN